MITQEEKIYAMEIIVSMVANDYKRKEIQKQKTTKQATKRAKELCKWSGFGGSKMIALGGTNGIEVSTKDERYGVISWRELAEYVREETKEQVSMF